MNVAIVGGGPAGSVLALLLARAGIEVTLCERAESPRAKPCGDCLSAEATRILDRIGVLRLVEAAGPARLDGWRIVAPRGHSFTAGFADMNTGDARLDCALALSRDRLDAVLLDAARAAGADVRTRTVVRHIETGPRPRIDVRGPAGVQTIRADLIVGADGLRSTVVRRLGLVRRPPRVRKISLTAHIELASGEDALGEMHLAPDLCAGLAPVGHGLYNLTLVADARRFGRTIAADAPGFFVRSLNLFPELPARLSEARLGGHRLPHAAGCPVRDAGLLASGPFDVPVRAIAGPGWALVGDAAGYFDPFTGQGIFTAMRGAELLARAIIDNAAPGPAALADYARELRRLTAPARTLQRIIESVLRRPTLADRAIDRLARAPAAARALLAATSDVRPPSSLLSPAVLLSFAVPRIRSAAG